MWLWGSSLTLHHSNIHFSERPLLSYIFRQHPFVFLTLPHKAHITCMYAGPAHLTLYVGDWMQRHIIICLPGGSQGHVAQPHTSTSVTLTFPPIPNVSCPCRQTRQPEKAMGGDDRRIRWHTVGWSCEKRSMNGRKGRQGGERCALDCWSITCRM